MKINLEQRLQDAKGKERFIDPDYSPQLMFENIMNEVENLWGKEKANKLVESLGKKQLTPEKASLKNILVMSLSKHRTDSMDEALKNYRMLDRVRNAETELDLGLEECENILEKVHSTFKDTLVTGQVKELTVDKFEKKEDK